MNRDDLAAALVQRRVPADAYSIEVERDETYCMIPTGDVFDVFYSERGHRNAVRAHASEDSACRDLLDRLLDDGSVTDRSRAQSVTTAKDPELVEGS